jgi:DNA-binding FadR family transcriptional regulator
VNADGRLRSRPNSRGLKPQKTAILLAQRIVTEISERRLEPGAPFPTEQQMLSDYGVARGTLREALRYLELQGVITIRTGPGGGPFVTMPDSRHLASTLALVMQMERGTYRSIVEAREIAEPALAARSAMRAGPEQIEALQESVRRLAAALDDQALFLEENARFHNLISEIAGNELFRRVTAALNWIMDGSVIGVSYPREVRGFVLKSHEEIAAAIAARDPALAAERMSAHLVEYEVYVRREFGGLLDQPIRWEDVSV